jgi:hypothetical protein
MQSITNFIRKLDLLLRSEQFAIALVLIGALLRIDQYLVNRSISHDEAMVALNIIRRSPLDLFKALDFFQSAPVGFLLLEKIPVTVFGPYEYALRMVPFIAGILSIWLMYRLARYWLPASAVPVAVLLFVCSNSAIYFSNELKQYATDIFFTLVLLVMTAQIDQSPLTPRRSFIYGLIGALILWFSHPALMILAAIAVGQIVYGLWHKEFARLRLMAISYALWGVSFILSYFVVLSPTRANVNDIINLWENLNAFIPLPPRSGEDLALLGNALAQLFTFVLDLKALAVAGIVLYIVGCLTLVRRNPRLLIYALLPILITLVLSSFIIYPFFERLLMFLAPGLIIVTVTGLETVITLFGRTFIGSAVPRVALVIPLMIYLGFTVNSRQVLEELRPVLEFVRTNARPGDTFYIHAGTNRAFEYYLEVYYKEDSTFADYMTLANTTFRVATPIQVADLARLEGKSRVWMLFAHYWRQDRDAMLAYMDASGERIVEYTQPVAGAYLYNLPVPAAAEPLRLTLDINDASLWSFKHITPEADGVMRLTGNDPYVAFNSPLQIDPSLYPYLCVRMTIPNVAVKGAAALYYATSDQASFSESRRISQEIISDGQTRGYFFDLRSLKGQLITEVRFDPFNLTGTEAAENFQIHDFFLTDQLLGTGCVG